MKVVVTTLSEMSLVCFYIHQAIWPVGFHKLCCLYLLSHQRHSGITDTCCVLRVTGSEDLSSKAHTFEISILPLVYISPEACDLYFEDEIHCPVPPILFHCSSISAPESAEPFTEGSSIVNYVFATTLFSPKTGG